jgi:hypothetical protein
VGGANRGPTPRSKKPCWRGLVLLNDPPLQRLHSAMNPAFEIFLKMPNKIYYTQNKSGL